MVNPKGQRAVQHAIIWGGLAAVIAAIALPDESCQVVAPDGTTQNVTTGQFDCSQRPNWKAAAQLGIIGGLSGAIAAYHD